ncbi:MAG: hypothetical protein QM749_01450 [Aquabacterium sp.]
MKKFSAPSTSPRQSGMVLIVALVMLVVIGLASVAIMRNVMSTDVISDNNRLNAQAMQAAQAALRYCETHVTALDAVADPADESWHDFGNWNANSGTNVATNVPTDFVTSADNSVTKRKTDRKAPQCMAQKRSLTGTAEVTVVTARGFSDNYVQDTAGHTQSGAVVWLQSIVKF